MTAICTYVHTIDAQFPRLHKYDRGLGTIKHAKSPQPNNVYFVAGHDFKRVDPPPSQRLYLTHCTYQLAPESSFSHTTVDQIL